MPEKSGLRQGSIVLVADASESNAGRWPVTASALAALAGCLPPGSVAGAGFLGTDLWLPPSALHPGMTPPHPAPGALSLMAPVMGTLQRRHVEPLVIIIIGAYVPVLGRLILAKLGK